MRSLSLVRILFALSLWSGVAAAADLSPPVGQRVFYTGHSFHMFVPKNVEQIVKAAGVQGHKFAGQQGIGGSRVIQHWDLADDKNKAKPALKTGEVDVFTMAAHVEIPDPGITHFTELALKHNPNTRLLVQASWFPFDVPEPDKRIKDNAQRDNAKIADLQKAVDDWRTKLEAQVDDLNKQHGRRSLWIVPAGDAVVKLRGLVADGKFPGVTKQSELFRDPIGHGLTHLQWLVSYCNYATIYQRNPVGLKLMAEGITDEQHAILQRIAWDTVSHYAYSGVADSESPKNLKLLFLGDNGHHQPKARFDQLQPVMKERGIELTYSGKVEDLNAETLDKYDGLVVYANTTKISDEQEKALLDYVASGKGFVPLHCASYCFLNSPKYIELVGAQFKSHKTGTFGTILAAQEHPLMRGFGGFESWDETYVHTKHNEKDRTVVEYRQEGDRKEPWTWVRTHGKGRVFYTAWGHDQRTWGNPGFQNLVERGIRWAVGSDPAVVPAFVSQKSDVTPRNATEGVPSSAFTAGVTPAPQMTAKRTDVKPFEFGEGNIPFYPAGQRWGTVTSGQRKIQQPLTVEESMKHFVTPVGFEVKLFVAEPQLEGKPIYMTWDERGRLWVCETYDYPNELQPIGQGRDRIRICEDTDGDGRADKFTVFADKLSIPTTLAFYRGGAIVQNGTETIYLKDTNGDDKADFKKTLVTGWSMRDTHGEVSNFRYGLDNWYYAMQGYNPSEPVLTNGKKVTGFRQGFFRFKVEGENENVAINELEFLRSTNNNTWGLGISEEGIIFGSTANGNPSEHMPIPNRYYEAVRGWSSTVLNGIADSNKFEPITENVRQVDWHGGFTAGAGHALYTARNYPREYWNRTAFVTEPTGHLVATFVIRQQGAGFKSKNSWNLVASDDEWTSPIQAEVGPEGNVWFLDWYNFIVQHNPTPAGFQTGKGQAYETPLRDKKHGRIYRLVHVGRASGRPLNENPITAGETPAPQLVNLLKSDNMQQRLLGQRLLVERGDKSVIPALVELAKDQSVDAIGLNTAAIHAIGTLNGLQAIDTNVAASALKHPAAGVRRVAVQLLPAGESTLSALLDTGVLNDREVQVRLQAILALAQFKPEHRVTDAVIAALADPAVQGDTILLDAVTAAAAGQDQLFLTTVAASMNAALATPAAADRIAIVAEHVARSDAAEPRPLVAALGQAQPAVASAILRGFVRGWPRDRKIALTPEFEQSLSGLFDKLPPAAKSQVATLATRWGSQGLGEQIAKMAATFLETAGKADQGDADRIAAATQFVELQKSDAAGTKLLELITPRSSPELARGLVAALGKSESPAVGTALADQLPKLTPAVRQSALSILLSRNDWTMSLVEAIEQGKLQLADLSLDQKQALANHPDRRIVGRSRRVLSADGGLPNPDRQKVLDELVALTHQKGDVTAGKLVFKNQCAKCHTHSGEGTKIGPDLTGMAVHPKHELLIHLIDPSRSVEGNYRVYTVLTAEGQTINGLLASETKTAIELIDTEAKRHIVLREDIENLQASTKSLMPEGFEKQVKPQELTDLLEFLTLRGKYVPIPLDKVATATSARGMFQDENSTAERLVFADWGPKTVEEVPFVLVDPQDGKAKNTVLLYGPQGKIPPSMPRSVSLPCSFPVKAVHLLSGVSGWGFPGGQHGSTSLIVRLTYADGQTEDHKLTNGEHFADYIRRVDVPQSKFAFNLRGKQLRYLSVPVNRDAALSKIDLVKGDDRSAPVVMAVTVETR
jgi:putative membrane-bound dehydrogenase-like protein